MYIDNDMPNNVLGVFAVPGKGLRAACAVGAAPHWGSGASATYECAHNSYMSSLVYNDTSTHTHIHLRKHIKLGKVCSDSAVRNDKLFAWVGNTKTTTKKWKININSWKNFCTHARTR